MAYRTGGRGGGQGVGLSSFAAYLLKTNPIQFITLVTLGSLFSSHEES